ncbi:MAG TPA: peptidylprolyl isomerase [Vicinamibacterales bacterium]|jgi:cyclophilin family peptidyl-prolyl cis-trans isomerase/HEAT repeat protein|nr:peptidylprolyl isomerase [Vicinamibacterales bacterium]
MLGFGNIVALALATALPIQQTISVEARRIHAILVAEDARAPTAADLEAILDGTKSNDPAVRRAAVRALGRLERPELLDRIAALLEDGDAGVRREAANAVGQSVFNVSGGNVRRAAAVLTERLSREPDAAVRGALLQTLGRLEYSAEDVSAVQRTLATYASLFDSTRVATGTAGRLSRRSMVEVDGAVRGLSRLFARRPNTTRSPAPETIKALEEATRSTFPTVGAAMEAERYARVRRLAVQTLGVSSAVTDDAAVFAFTDRDWQVRRLAVQHGAALPGGVARSVAALKDASPQVRFEALRSLGQSATIPCAAIVPLTRDVDAHVARRAAATLAQPCNADSAPALATLVSLASAPTRDREGRWHLAASALGSLATACTRRDSGPKSPSCDRAPELVRAHAQSRVWQTRMYAARSAGNLSDLGTLRRLARDSHPNVREAAIEILGTRTPREDDALIAEALNADDYQLVLTAARLFKDSKHPGAVSALRAAFDRLVAKRSDTARDPLTAIAEALAARGVAVSVPPSSPKSVPFTNEELTDLLARPHRATVTMASGGSFELVLMPEEASATVARFVRLARQRVYDGLTFHRVEPDFVIQGGSPGANEYAGHDPYMRDEVGLVSHDRGTLGISTRGHDTGDAQIFINLVDNPRLDHRYTVFARVVRGMEVVDRIVEGDAISRIVSHLQN